MAWFGSRHRRQGVVGGFEGMMMGLEDEKKK